jgi:hypothetical protein
MKKAQDDGGAALELIPCLKLYNCITAIIGGNLTQGAFVSIRRQVPLRPVASPRGRLPILAIVFVLHDVKR